MNIFSPDSKFSMITNLMLDFVKLGLLVMLFSIPVVTAGSAFTAAMKVAMSIQRGEAPIILGPFWKAFKENFKQSLGFTLLFGAFAAMLTMDAGMILEMPESGLIQVIRLLLIILILLLVLIAGYSFAIIARFELRLGAVIHNALIYTILNFHKNILVMAILVLSILGYRYLAPLVPVIVCVCPAVILWYFSKVCSTSFEKQIQAGNIVNQQRS